MERFKKRLTSRTHKTARTRDYSGFFWGRKLLYIAFFRRFGTRASEPNGLCFQCGIS